MTNRSPIPRRRAVTVRLLPEDYATLRAAATLLGTTPEDLAGHWIGLGAMGYRAGRERPSGLPVREQPNAYGGEIDENPLPPTWTEHALEGELEQLGRLRADG